jgi:hypothetical protein
VTSVLPKAGETINPEGFPFAPSKLRYFVGFPSIAFATPSDPGLFAEEAITGSPGCATLWAYVTELAAKKLLTNTVCIRRFMLSLGQKVRILGLRRTNLCLKTLALSSISKGTNGSFCLAGGFHPFCVLL